MRQGEVLWQSLPGCRRRTGPLVALPASIATTSTTSLRYGVRPMNECSADASDDRLNTETADELLLRCLGERKQSRSPQPATPVSYVLRLPLLTCFCRQALINY